MKPTVSVSRSFWLPGQQELAGRRVERREELVLGQDGGARQGVQERGLAGVGVADDGRRRHGHAHPARALDAALAHDLGQLLLQVGDPRAHDAPVLLELGLALAAHGAPAALARQVGPRPGEARQGVLHPGEGDLEDGLPGVRPVGEDLEDDLLAVDDGHARKLLPVALLRRREGGVEDDHLGPVLLGLRRELLGLALAEQQGRGRAAQPTRLVLDDREAQVLDQLRQLGQELLALARRHLGRLHADQEGALRLGQGG